jgi:hypothetical protein
MLHLPCNRCCVCRIPWVRKPILKPILCAMANLELSLCAMVDSDPILCVMVNCRTDRLQKAQPFQHQATPKQQSQKFNPRAVPTFKRVDTEDPSLQRTLPFRGPFPSTVRCKLRKWHIEKGRYSLFYFIFFIFFEFSCLETGSRSQARTAG